MLWEGNGAPGVTSTPPTALPVGGDVIHLVGLLMAHPGTLTLTGGSGGGAAITGGSYCYCGGASGGNGGVCATPSAAASAGSTGLTLTTTVTDPSTLFLPQP